MLRVCCFNVRRFSSPQDNQQNTIERIISAFQQLTPLPAIFCINEVNLVTKPDALNTFSEKLGALAGLTCPYEVSFFGHVKGVYGNAILVNPSVASIVRTQTHELPGGTKIQMKPGAKKISGEIMEKPTIHRIVRGLVQVELDLNIEFEGERYMQKNVTVACTHLDHMKEEERRIQLEYISKHILGGKDGGLLLGDLNALKRRYGSIFFSNYQVLL